MNELVMKNVASLVRIALGALGALLVSKGIDFPDTLVDEVAGAIAVITGAVWAVLKNRRATV